MLKAVFTAAIVAMMASLPLASAEDCTKDQIISIVNKACDLVVSQGDKAYDALSKPEFNGKCSSYVWIHEYKGDGIIVTFHPANTNMMGKDMVGLKDPNGKPIFGTFRKAAPKNGNIAWVGYMWPKAGQETPAPKCSYLKNCDGKLTAGMGIYGDCAGLGIKNAQ